MRAGHQKVARAYVLYREERARLRAEKQKEEKTQAGEEPVIQVTLEDGSRKPLDSARLRRVVEEACRGLSDVEPEAGAIQRLAAAVFQGDLDDVFLAGLGFLFLLLLGAQAGALLAVQVELALMRAGHQKVARAYVPVSYTI